MDKIIFGSVAERVVKTSPVPVMVVNPFKQTWNMLYSGCQKNVPLFKRFFFQPLIPPFRISEFIFGKRYNLTLHRKPAAKRLPIAVKEFLIRVEIMPCDSDATEAYARLRTSCETPYRQFWRQFTSDWHNISTKFMHCRLIAACKLLARV